MAEIKVQRKGLPWWAWLILALIAVAALWWAIETFGGDGSDARTTETLPASAPTASAPVAAPVEPTDTTLTDIGTVLDSDNPASLVGREVQLHGVKVLEMVGDATFWVGRSDDARAFVILDEHIPAPPPNVEGRVNVNTGQTVDIVGSIRASDDLPGDDVLDSVDRKAVSGQKVYIWARSATVATRP